MKRLIALAVIPIVVAACSRRPDVDQVPVGTDVQVTRDDGGVVKGKLTARDDKSVKIDVGPVTREVAKGQIADVQVVDAAQPPALPPSAKFLELTVPSGTHLTLRLEADVSSATSHVEDPVTASIVDPITVDGRSALPAGSQVTGIVSSVESSGKVKGRASLAIAFNQVTANGGSYDISARFSREAAANTRDDAKKIGIPAAGGALIGALIGGKKGAAVGAAVGGGAGTAAVLATPGDEIVLPRGTTLAVTLANALTVKVPVK